MRTYSTRKSSRVMTYKIPEPHTQGFVSCLNQSRPDWNYMKKQTDDGSEGMGLALNLKMSDATTRAIVALLGTLLLGGGVFAMKTSKESAPTYQLPDKGSLNESK